MIQKHPEVILVNSSIQEVLLSPQYKFDLVVLPGNPYGFCVSGLDGAIQELFGPGVHEEISNLIKEDYGGKQPVVTSFIFSVSGDLKIAYTPFFPRGEYTTQLGMEATLRVIHEWNTNQVVGESKDGENYSFIRSVCCPGLGIQTIFNFSISQGPIQECVRKMS
eukprot:TRINITY_DN4042_c0_g1_i2.p1 TRINITY_DN4042_c0_g1~~TRINITY_DN4042_c0_g1_i2.p1  ORF type:complete len:164 (+),score=18.20 TRINITY_DN4042_c0_g1_i2:131-622(+)